MTLIVNAALVFLYFQIMIIMIQTQFIPVLNLIVEITNIPKSIAGITLISFGNGAADLFSIFTSLGQSRKGLNSSFVKLGFGEVIGSSILISLTTIGLIVLTFTPAITSTSATANAIAGYGSATSDGQGSNSAGREFKISSSVYLRDSLFLIFSLWIFAFFAMDSKLELWEGLFMSLFYCAYVFLSSIFALCGETGNFSDSRHYHHQHQLTINPSSTSIQIQNAQSMNAAVDSPQDELISITGLPSAAPSSTSLFADADQTLDLDYFQPSLHFRHSFPFRDTLQRKLEHSSAHVDALLDARHDVPEQEPDLNLEDCLEFQPVHTDLIDNLKYELSIWTPFVWPVRCYWTKLATWERVVGILQAPVIAVIMLSSPVLEVVHLDLEKDRVKYIPLPIEPEIVMEDDEDQIIQSKQEYPLSLLLCQLFFAPISWALLVYVENNAYLTLILPSSIGSGFLLATLFNHLCKGRRRISDYAGILSLISFVQSLTLIVRISDSLVQNLLSIGVGLHIPSSILGLTVLAFGNSIGELVTNTYVANQVSMTTGVTACYGGPIMNLLLGIGLSTVYHTVSAGGEAITFEPLGVPFWTAFFMLVFGLICSIAIIIWKGFHLTRSFSYFVIVYSICTYSVLLVLALFIQ